jgi:hypothetical protein
VIPACSAPDAKSGGRNSESTAAEMEPEAAADGIGYLGSDAIQDTTK